MASKVVPACANCSADASIRCIGCAHAPEYQPGDHIETTYCSHSCQDDHWDVHKDRCHALGRRKILLRAASLVKAMVLGYREVVYDIDLTKIEFKDGVLNLYQNEKSFAGMPKRRLFPDHLTTNIEHKEAALVKNQGSMAMVLAGRTLLELLKDVALDIEKQDVQIEEPIMLTNLIPDDFKNKLLHKVFVVELWCSEEKWVIDIAGGQFGFREVLMPYHKYMESRPCHTVGRPRDCDKYEAADVYKSLIHSFAHATPALLDHLENEREAREHFSAFVKKAIARSVLDGPESRFANKVKKVASRVRSHMLSSGKISGYRPPEDATSAFETETANVKSKDEKSENATSVVETETADVKSKDGKSEDATSSAETEAADVKSDNVAESTTGKRKWPEIDELDCNETAIANKRQQAETDTPVTEKVREIDYGPQSSS